MYLRTAQGSWLDDLSDEDVAFLKRFVLAGGSLKDLAAAYDVSYPTIRLRLDRLVEKIQFMDQYRTTSPFERTIMAMYADGKVDVNTMKALLVAHQREMQNRESKPNPQAKSKPG
jgi:hypothetical protein